MEEFLVHLQHDIAVVVKFLHSFEEKLFEIRQDLQSSISYGGGNNLDIFQEVDYHHM